MAGPVSARDFFDLVVAIKGRIDKVSDNQAELKDLADRLYEDINRLLNCIHSQRELLGKSKHPLDAEFDHCLSVLKSDLIRIQKRCNAMIRDATIFSKPGIKKFFQGAARADDIFKEIKSLRRKVKSHYLRFSASGMANVARNVSDIRRQLQRVLSVVDKKLSDSVTEATVDIDKATQLTGADQMDQVMMTMTLKRATKELQSDDVTALEKAYLQTKVNTLRRLLGESFGSVQGPDLVRNTFLTVPISIAPSTSETVSTSHSDPGDAVMQCLRSLRTLQDGPGSSLPNRHSSPDSLHQFATDLEALSKSVSEIGFVDDAARVFKHAVKIRRTLAEDNFGQYREQLAATLNNYAALLIRVDRTCKEVLDCAEEAVQIYEDLFREDPDTYDLHFAAMAHNFASVSFQAGHPMAALHHSNWAIEIIRPRAEEDFDAFAPTLASYLITSALGFCEINCHGQGLPLIQEAAEIYHKLSGDHFNQHYPALAESLSILSDIQWSLGACELARLAIDAAVQIGRDLTSVADCPRIHQECLSHYLHTLFLRLECVDEERALDIIIELVQLRRKLARDDTSFSSYLGVALYNKAAVLCRLGRYDEAEGVVGEALFVKKSLAEDVSTTGKAKSSVTACLEMQAEIKKRLNSSGVVTSDTRLDT